MKAISYLKNHKFIIVIIMILIAFFPGEGSTAIQLITSSNGDSMDTDGTYVYWSEISGEFCSPPGSIKRIRVTGGAVQTLYSDCYDFDPWDIIVDGTWVYANDWSNGIVKVPATGGSPITVAQDNGAIYHRGFAADDTSVFWVDNGGVKQAAKNGSSTIILEAAPSSYGYDDVSVDDIYVYWLVSEGISRYYVKRVVKGGGPIQTLYTSPSLWANTRSLVVDETHLYWVEDGVQPEYSAIIKKRSLVR